MRQGGKQPILQLEDCLRHGKMSRKSRQSSAFHEAAHRWFLSGGQGQPSSEQSEGEKPLSRSVSACQLAICLDIVYSPLGAQGLEYAKRCTSQRRRGRTTGAHSLVAPNLQPVLLAFAESSAGSCTTGSFSSAIIFPDPECLCFCLGPQDA